ncbi:MAG: undecaprenyl-diphosphate phosphatase [Marinicella sp.]
MLDALQWVVLALVQGLTEFLPISSSAHLILATEFAGWQDQGLVMDIAAHFGSLLAVLMYYRKDVFQLLSGQDWPLFQQLFIASVPIALVGLVLAEFIDNHLREVWVIAAASAFFGVLLWRSQDAAGTTALNLKIALLIGLAQCLALIPGASRSGVTMTAAMALGLSKTHAAKFSFLLAIPAILMTSTYGGMKLIQSPHSYDLTAIATIITLSFFAAWICIHWFMRLIEKIDFKWFMIYRLLLAVIILLTLI